MDNVPFVQISVAIVTFVLAFTFRKALISKLMVDGEMSKMNNFLATMLIMIIPINISYFTAKSFFPASNVSYFITTLIFLVVIELYFYVLTKIEKVKPTGFVSFFTK